MTIRGVGQWNGPVSPTKVLKTSFRGAFSFTLVKKGGGGEGGGGGRDD